MTDISIRNQDSIDEKIWDVSAWYIVPESSDSPSFQKLTQNSEFVKHFEDNKLTCAQALPFISQPLHSDYAKAIASGTYIGLKDTGMFCNSPFGVTDFITEGLASDEY